MYDRPSLGILGICSDENSSYQRGASEAPPLIRAAFHCAASNGWSESGRNLWEEGLFHDAGDIYPAAGEAGLVEIERGVDDLLERGLRPILLGGDHAITHPVLRAFRRQYPRLAILHIDAHPDLYDEFKGSRFSHACPFARIMEEGLVQRLVQVGVRTISQHLRDQAQRFQVEMIEMKDWLDDRRFIFEEPVYISFDLDGLDPACAPGVSHPEPGGFTTRQVVKLIQDMTGRIVGADIVEYNPRRDVNGMTAGVAAKLLKEIASRMLGECQP
jgi:arginase